jgi:cell wall-associated NlpC family hydrolase/peptidoglycan hydrolase CwlO-like protein
MPRRVNPVILLGIIIVAVMSFGISAGAAPEDGAGPASVSENDVAINEVTTPVVEPSGEGGAPSGVLAPENTIATGESEAPDGSAPVGEAVPEDDINPEDAAQNEGDAASEEQEDALEEVITPEESPAQEDAESDDARDGMPQEAEIGEIAEEAGAEFQQMLTDAEAADGQFNNALLEENQLTSEIAETRNDLTAAEDSLGEAQGRLEDRASQMYMNGPNGYLGMLLGAEDFSAFKDLLGLWVQLLNQDQKEVEEWRENRNQLEQNSRDLEAQLEEWEQTREEARTMKEEAEAHVEQAQEFFEAQDQKVQEKIEEDRAREAELALDYVGKMLQEASGEQPSELVAAEEENSGETETTGKEPGQAEEDQSETGANGTAANETAGDEMAIQLAGEDKSEEIEQARQTGAEAPDRTPEEEQVRQAEVAQALGEAIQEWQAQKKPLAEKVQEPAKEREAGATQEGRPSGIQTQNPAAEQMATAAEEQAKAHEQSMRATEQAAAERQARETATMQAEEAKKAKLAVEQLPVAEQEAAKAAAQEAERNAAVAADNAAQQKSAAEDAAKRAMEQKGLAVELEEAAAQKDAENSILDPKLNPKLDPKIGTSGSKVLDYAETWMGVPYDYSHSAGMTRAKVDCSAFTAAVYKKFGITLPDSPIGQLGTGAPVSGPAKAGDLVFFSEDGSGVPTHVGIANGDGTLTHASNFTGEVSVTDMDYLTGYMGARRLI